jgi:hypothetical protein
MELEGILSEFPFMQSARALHLKGLYNQDSFRYNLELKKAAAHTTDRSVLFDFITSEQFQSIQKKFFEEKEKAVEEIPVAASEIIKAPVDKLEESIKLTIQEAEEKPKEVLPMSIPYNEEKTEATISKLEESIKLTIKEAGEQVKKEEPLKEAIAKPTEEPVITAIEKTEEKLEIGKPLEFDKQEKHSFQEWLQLARLTPIDREENNEKEAEEAKKEPEIEESKSKKLDLIDKFIEANPKISPVKNHTPTPANIEKSSQDTSFLMTETLARVYLEQKKYQKAIQAYEILILKYPEKNAFFADRILDIKILQQNNN